MTIEIQKTIKKMEKFNRNLGITLAILSILSCVANMFNMLGLPAIIASFAFSALVGCIAMIQTYHHDENLLCDNHISFWIFYSVISGIIMFIVSCVGRFGWIENHIATSIIFGLIPTLMPIVGVFFGNFGRILFKGEPSVI